MSGCYPEKPYKEFSEQMIKLIANKIDNDLLEILKDKLNKESKEQYKKIHCTYCGKSTIISV